MVESKGWLKPIKLKEITGTPAAEVIAAEIRKERLEKRRMEQIKRYHSRLAMHNGGKSFPFNGHLSPQNDDHKGRQLH